MPKVALEIEVLSAEAAAEPTQIATPKRLRSILLATISGLLEGRVSVNHANAVANLSSEVHKSVRQEWDMVCFAEKADIQKAQIRLLGDEDAAG